MGQVVYIPFLAFEKILPFGKIFALPVISCFAWKVKQAADWLNGGKIIRNKIRDTIYTNV